MTQLQKKHSDCSIDVQRLVAVRDEAVKQFTDAFEKREDAMWVLEMLEEVLVIMHVEQGVDRVLLDGCRSAVFARAHSIISGQNPIETVCREIKGTFPKQCGHIYALQDENGLVKIGRSINPDRRIECIRTQAGKMFARVYVSPQTPSYSNMERHLHKMFDADRHVGEWFKADMDSIIAAAEQYLLAKKRVEGFAEVIGKSLVPVAHNQIGE